MMTETETEVAVLQDSEEGALHAAAANIGDSCDPADQSVVVPAECDSSSYVEFRICGYVGVGEVLESFGHRPFQPVDHDLDAKFRLTNYSQDFKNLNASKVSQEDLDKLLDILRNKETNEHEPYGIGMDCSLTALRHGELVLVQTTDSIYAVVDDPYMQGKIACANVLSDLYAVGVTECDSMLMVMAISTKLTEKERDVVIPLMIRGFKDAAIEAHTSVTGGQTVMNPWITIGGAASSVCLSKDILLQGNAIAGDVLVLTKPLGTQVAVSAHHCLDTPELYKRITVVVSEEDVRKAYDRAIDSMARLNRTAARLMHKFNTHGATDITGFGLLGHAQNLAKLQNENVSFVIHNLPIIAKMSAVSRTLRQQEQLLQGRSAEISGGLLITLPRVDAALYCKEMEKETGYQSAWIVGLVEEGDKTARVIARPRVIEVPAKDIDGQLW